MGSHRLQALALGLALLAVAALLSLSAVPLANKIAAEVQERIRQQVVWQPNSPESVAGEPGWG